MKKKFSLILIIFCVFSLNTTFVVNNAFANPPVEKVEQVAVQQNNKVDVLEEPVFEQEKTTSKSKKITGKLSSIIIKIFGGVLLLFVAVICLSFIFFANEQRRREKKRKKLGTNSNVINAVDNFARHRIKR